MRHFSLAICAATISEQLFASSLSFEEVGHVQKKCRYLKKVNQRKQGKEGLPFSIGERVDFASATNVIDRAQPFTFFSASIQSGTSREAARTRATTSRWRIADVLEGILQDALGCFAILQSSWI